MRRKPMGNRIAVLVVATATMATLGAFTVSDGVYDPVVPDIVNTGIEIPVVTPRVSENGILTAEDFAALNEPEEPEKPKTYAEIPLGEERQLLLFSICEEYSVPAEIALAVIQTESTFDNTARNGSCHGYMQVSTINRTWLNSDIGITDLTDPDQNLRAGCYMLSVLYPQFLTLEELQKLRVELYQPFADSLDILNDILTSEEHSDGGAGSGNFGHSGVPGQVGGSAPSLTSSASTLLHGKSDDFKADFLLERGVRFREVNKAMQDGKLDELVDEKVRKIARERDNIAGKAPDDAKIRKSAVKASLEIRNEPTEILVVYDKDGNEIGRNTGNTQEVKNSELGETYSTLHNHPGDTDSCFSGADVRSFANTGEQVMYMTSTSKLYSLQKTSDYDGYSARSVATHIDFLEKKYQDGDMTRNELIAETDLYLQLHAHEFGLVYKQQDVSAKNVDSEEKPLDFSMPGNTITSKGTTDDGAPVGNQNAAGPHRRSHLSAADKEKYSERLIGLTTSAGTEVKAITGHAFDRIAELRISASRIEDMIKNGKVSPDKTHPDRHVYDIPGSRMVLNYETGTIITVEWRNQNR